MGSSASKETSRPLTGPQSLGSLLCQEWWFDRDHRSWITFQRDGTGQVRFFSFPPGLIHHMLIRHMLIIRYQLSCGDENNLFIAAEFQWEVGNALDVTLHPDDPGVLIQCTLQITLQKQCWDPTIPRRGYKINEAVLTDDAFLPKQYALTVERGRFATADYAYAGVSLAEVPSWVPRFAFRLSLSPSTVGDRRCRGFSGWRGTREGAKAGAESGRILS